MPGTFNYEFSGLGMDLLVSKIDNVWHWIHLDNMLGKPGYIRGHLERYST